MIWSHRGMSNWYRNAKGRLVAPTPFRNDDYWHMARRTDLSDYEVRTPGNAARKSVAQEAS
jgi:4-hydroxyacetophenone monooxygenase